MLSIYQIKPLFQKSLRPFCNLCVQHGITPNQVTLAALVLSLIVGSVAALLNPQRWILWLYPLVLLIRMALNAIDGMIAREYNQQTALGTILNELGDVIADAALYLPFALFGGVGSSLVLLVVLLSTFTEMTGVVVVLIGSSRRYDGPMGKSDRAFSFAILAIAMAVGMPSVWVNIILIILSLLCAFTIYQRAQQGINEVATRG